MTDRDDSDMQAWARYAFADEPEPGRLGDTIGDDLARAHAGLTRRRRWTAGVSGVAVAAAAFAIAMAPSLTPSAGDSPEPAGAPDASQHRKVSPPKQAPQAPAGDGYPAYEQRKLLYDVAKDHIDPRGKHLSMAQNVQSGDSGGIWSVGTKLNWKIPDEPGLGMVQVGIASSGMNDRDLRFEMGCDEYSPCQRRELPDGTSAWVRQDGDSALSVGYRQADGESVWVTVDPLFGNNSRTPVSSVDVGVGQMLAFVTDDRLRVIDSNVVTTWDGRVVPKGCPRGDGEKVIYPDDPPPGQVPDNCPKAKD